MAEKEMRKVYTETLIELAEENEKIVLLEADLMRASGTGVFAQRFPERTFNVGVAEANMVGIAAGLSAGGKIPFADTFGCFASRRAFDQFFLSGCYAKQNIKLVGTDPGVAAAYNGGTHMPFEDVGLMRVIPDLVIFEPSDEVSLQALVKESATYYGCTYMRLPRKALPKVYEDNASIRLGKGNVLREGDDVLLIASGGIMVQESLKAHAILAEKGIAAAVIDMHTIKPLDGELIKRYAAHCRAVITCENHQINNGLGSAVAEFLMENALHPAFKRVGIEGQFGEVGTQVYLQERFGLTADNIVQKALSLLG